MFPGRLSPTRLDWRIDREVAQSERIPSNLILEKWVDCQLGSLTAGVIVEKGRDDCPWGCLGLQDKGEEGDP
ncbi:hypothetical protein Tco_0252477 [Tanacetum coccineum]